MLVNKISKLCVLVLFIGFFTGCTSMHPMPNYARPGDSITLSIGGSNSVPSGMLRKENITVQITDSSGQVHNAKLRNLFRVFSDPTSRYATRNRMKYGVEGSSGLMQGQWMALIDLIDPSTSINLPLSVGAATLNIIAPEYEPPVGTWGHGDLSSIPIEIIEGQGSPNTLNRDIGPTFDMVNALEPEPQVLVRLDSASANGASIAGVEYVFSFVVENFNTAYYIPDAILMTPNQDVQIIKSKIPGYNGTINLKVIVLGDFSDALKYKEMDISLVWINNSTVNVSDENWMDSIQLVSSKYIDSEGNVLPQLLPVLTKIR